MFAVVNVCVHCLPTTLTGSLFKSLRLTLLSLHSKSIIEVEIMSGLSTPFYGTLKGYWSSRTRRRYQRLNKTTAKKGNNQRVARFGARKRALLSLWRSKLQVRVIRRQLLRLRSRAGIVSPVKLIGSLRNAYIDLMLRLAGNVGSLSTGNAFSDSRRVADAGLVTRNAIAPRVDIDQEKLVFEIYHILAASQ